MGALKLIVDQHASPEAKIALFRSLFRGERTSIPVGSRAEGRENPATRPRVPTSGSAESVRSHASSALSVRTANSSQ